jgi:NADP-dependent 3-hydroxy acid dehydrogenase YdfG
MLVTHGLDPIQTGDLDDWDAMIDINVKACCMFRKPSFPNDRENQVISSILVPLLQKKYQTEMYIVLQNMRLTPKSRNAMDLNPFGIRVGAIHPGMVQTEFSEVRFKGDTDRAEKYIRVHTLTTKILLISFIS